MRGLLTRIAAWLGLLTLVGLMGWKVVMLLASGVTLEGVATTLLMVNVMAGALAFWGGVFVLYVLSERYGQPAPQRGMIKK
jgi:hypothetical protein